jgi:two-component system response regulator FixJ
MNSRPSSQTVSHVFLVEDDENVRELLRLNLINAGFSVDAYASAVDFLAKLDPAAVGCLVTDVRMEPIDGVELVALVRQRNIAIPIVVMTGHADVGLAVRAMKVGAGDFIEKSDEPTILIGAVRGALAQVRLASDSLSERDDIRRRMDDLSHREREVLDLIGSGLTSRQIAENLDISPRTVDVHRAHIMEKMCAARLAQLVRMTTLIAEGA